MARQAVFLAAAQDPDAVLITLLGTTDHNWRIEPAEAVEALRRAALEQEMRVTPSAQTSIHNSIFSTLDLT